MHRKVNVGRTIYMICPNGANPNDMYRSDGTEGILRNELIKKTGLDVVFISGSQCAQMKDVAAIISDEFDPQIQSALRAYPRELCFLLVFEPPIIMPHAYHPDAAKTFGKIFIPSDDFIDNQHFFKMCYPSCMRMMDIPDFDLKKFCCLINNDKHNRFTGYELYSERRKIISFLLEATPEFDLYGDWKGIPRCKGLAVDKLNIIKHYKFSISYENMTNQRGYISEKIHHSIGGGCVPVYLGATNVTDYIPKECFIDRRDFSSEQQLYNFLRSIDRKTFYDYLDAHQKYMNGPQSKLFTVQYNVQIVLDHILKSIQNSQETS